MHKVSKVYLLNVVELIPLYFCLVGFVTSTCRSNGQQADGGEREKRRGMGLGTILGIFLGRRNMVVAITMGNYVETVWLGWTFKPDPPIFALSSLKDITVFSVSQIGGRFCRHISADGFIIRNVRRFLK